MQTSFARTVGSCAVLFGLFLAAACGSSSETVTAPSPTRCGVQLQAEKVTFAADGGSGSVRVTTNRECTWSAQSEAAWVSLATPTSGQGEGSVQFTVTSNGDPASRTTGVKIEDQRIQLTQEGRPCTFRLSSTLETVDSSGGDRTIQVSASSAQCHWVASADVPWIHIASGNEGNGDGAVGLHVDAVSGPQRNGTVTIAGQSVQIQQGTGCSFTIGTDSFSLGSAGGTGTVPVTAPPGCAWTAQSQTDWITLTSGATGTGPGTVEFRVTATDGPSRTGTLTVAGRTVTVVQSPGCTFALDPASYAAPLQAGNSSTSVRTAAGCSWTAASTVDWITITAGQSGNGPGQVQFSFTANTGPGRTGTLRIAGLTFTVTQTTGCSITVTPTSANFAAAGGTGTVQVATASGCAWSAKSETDWIGVAEGSNGSGNGQVQFAVAANAGPARQGSMTIGGHTISINQASGCSYTVTPSTQDVPPTGGPAAGTIATAAGCPWSASSDVPWIAVSTPSGSGPAQVSYTVEANSGPPRAGNVTIAARTIAVTQASSCTWSFIPPAHAFGPDGGSGNILVLVTGSCSWTATSGVEWIAITNGSAGIGNGLLQFGVAPNSGPARTGFITIAGQRYEVSQAAR
jgi:hypothetical protein